MFFYETYFKKKLYEFILLAEKYIESEINSIFLSKSFENLFIYRKINFYFLKKYS